MGFTTLRGRDLRTDVNSFVGESGKAKMELFKASYQNRKVDYRIIQKYIGALNGMLSKYGNKLKEVEDAVKSMGKVDPDARIRGCIAYETAKPVLYANFDYASVLQFADGLIKGINSNKMNGVDDVDDYFDHTVSIAFKNIPTSTASLVEDANSIRNTPVDRSEISHFNAVKGLRIYNEMDRRELYKASCKVIDYICDEINKNGGLGIYTDDASVKVAFVNSIIEFITYSITAFMYRTVIISIYADPFINYKANDEDGPVMSESVQEVNNKISEKDIRVMHDADDAILRDPANIEKFYDTINEFGQIVGISIFDKNPNLRNHWDQFNFVDRNTDFQNNIFNQELIGNPLYEFIRNKLTTARWDDVIADRTSRAADEFDTLVHNKKQGLSDTMSAAQEMFPIFRDTWKDKTSENDIETIIRDLGRISIPILAALAATARSIDNMRSDDVESDKPYGNNSVLNNNARIIKTARELYKDIALVVLSRFRSLEIIINKNRQKDIADGFADVSIKVPGDFKENDPGKEAMGDSVPDTSRMPVDLYGMPTYEACRMYSEYASYILGDDEFFNEAVDFSKIFDTLQAFLAAWYKKAIQFFDSAGLKNAGAWVENNQGTLKTAKYNGTMEVLPYKSDIKYPSMTEFNDKLNKFNADLLKSEKDFNAFIDSLYANSDNTLTTIWKSDSKTLNADIENYVLFGVAPGTNVQTKTLNTSEAIQTEMSNTWISTVLAAKTLRDAFVNGEKQADNAVKNIKTKIAATQSTNNQNNQDQNNQDQNNPNNQQQNNTNAQANDENAPVSPQTALSRIQTAYTKVVFPVYMIFHKAVMDQYNYIKQAYSMKAQ